MKTEDFIEKKKKREKSRHAENQKRKAQKHNGQPLPIGAFNLEHVTYIGK